MRRLLPAALAALLGSVGAAQAASGPITLIFNNGTSLPSGNSLVISDASGAGETNYPYQFGRPFVQGEIAHAPQVLINGVPAVSQADVKNRYPDGSVEYAVLAVVVPSIPASGSVTLTFADSTSLSNTPLTSAQLLDASYNFDADLTTQGGPQGGSPAHPGALDGGPVVPANQPLATWQAITNGGMSITINGIVCNLTGLNFAGLTAQQIVDKIAAALTAAAGQTVTWTAGSAPWTAVLAPTTGDIGFASPPATGQDISAFFGLTVASGASDVPASAGTPPGPGLETVTSARQMLMDGNCTPWTSGPVAQTMICADDSTAHKYDIGMGDGFQPLRPRFYATFWPATHQVYVRTLVDSGLMSAYEDAKYTATLTLGSTSPQPVLFDNLKEPVLDLSNELPQPHVTGLVIAQAEPAGYTGPVNVTGTPSSPVQGYPTHYHALIDGTLEDITSVAPGAPGSIYLYSGGPAVAVGDPITIGTGAPPKVHWAGTSWTQTAWLGGTPQPEVNVNYGLAYLDSTRWLPNYDASMPVDPASVASEYAAFTSRAMGPYDSVEDLQGIWTGYGGDPGARGDIGPENSWSARWVTSGDWRTREIAMAQADISFSWPTSLIETDPARVLNRGDAAGTGLGHQASIIGRPQLLTWAGDLGQSGSDGPIVVGTGYDVTSDANGDHWVIEGSHQAQMTFPEYVLTGDPAYLRHMEEIAHYDAARYTPNNPVLNSGRGPDGTYGIISDEPRGQAWVLRDRVEAAIAEPDAAVGEKTYLTTLTNDALAYWDGAVGATETPYDGTTMYAYGAANGLNNLFGAPLNPLHLMQTQCAGLSYLNSVELVTNVQWNVMSTDGTNFLPQAPFCLADPWMQEYTTWGVGRAAELGFTGAVPYQEYLGGMILGMMQSPNPYLIGTYEIPARAYDGTTYGAAYPDWGAFLGTDAAPWNYPALSPAFAQSPQQPGGLLGYFQGNLWSQGRPAYAMAALANMVDEGQTGAASAWTWMDTNVRQPIGQAVIPVGGSSILCESCGFQQDPAWDIVPRTDHNTLPVQPAAKE